MANLLPLPRSCRPWMFKATPSGSRSVILTEFRSQGCLRLPIPHGFVHKLLARVRVRDGDAQDYHALARLRKLRCPGQGAC